MQPSYDCRLHHSSHSEVESSSRKMACRSTLKRHVPLHGLVNRRAAHHQRRTWYAGRQTSSLHAGQGVSRWNINVFPLLIPRPRDQKCGGSRDQSAVCKGREDAATVTI